jgi:hypothetical protein
MHLLDSAKMTNRKAERVNMFIAATVYLDGSSCAARVRNLSPWGAMLDSKLEPGVGSVIKMARGQLVAAGEVVWARAGRFGVSFTHPTSVSNWLATAKNPGQEAVDQLFSAAAPLTVHSARTPLQEDLQSSGLKVTDAAQVEKVINLLASLGDRLSDDLGVVAQHGDVLQDLDQAMQILSGLKASIEAFSPIA